MNPKTGYHRIALLALSLVVAGTTLGQDQDAIQKARKLRAEAAYQEMKGDTAAALKSYQESLKYVKDPIVEQKIGALSATTAKPVAGGGRSYAGEVYSRLDVGGELLAFLSADGIVQPAREELKAVLNLVKEGMPRDKPVPVAAQFAMQLDPVLEWLGIYAVHGCGISLARQADGSYTYKEYALGSDDRSGALWRLAGKPVSPDLLAYLPEQTAAFAFSSVGVKTFWGLVLEGIEKFAGAPAKDAVLQQLGGVRESAGIDAQAMLQSLEDQWAFAVTLNTKTQLSIPLPTGKPFEFPEPGILLALAVKDGTIPTTLLAFLKEQGAPVKEKKVGGNTIYSVAPPAPLPVPIPLEPAMVLIDNNLLLLALHPATLEAAMASKAAGGSMLKSADFKKAFANLPEKVNSVFYMSKLLGETVVGIQKLVIESSVLAEATEGGNAAAIQLAKRGIEKLAARKDNRLAMYSVSDADGVLSLCNVYTSGMNPIAESIVTPMGLLAAAAMNGAEKARKEALAEGCMNNLYQIENAKAAWQMDTNAADGAEVDMAKFKEQLDVLPTCPRDGKYTIGKVGEKPSCTCGQTLD